MRPIQPFIQLTKPRIMLLVIVSGATAIILQGDLLHHPSAFILLLFGLYFTGGSANALNHYFERHIDSRMSRTQDRRPLPKGEIRPGQALIFALFIGVTGILIFALFFNLASAALALLTILFYSLFYTLFLKKKTSQNIVFGGIAGALVPVGAWVAAAGSPEWAAWSRFLIILFWSPPHFWALARIYHQAGLPMLPLVHGPDVTRSCMLIYAVLLLFSSLTPVLLTSGTIYFISALLSGLVFIILAVQAKQRQTMHADRRVFTFSILYLFLLFAFLIIDKIL